MIVCHRVRLGTARPLCGLAVSFRLRDGLPLKPLNTRHHPPREEVPVGVQGEVGVSRAVGVGPGVHDGLPVGKAAGAVDVHPGKDRLRDDLGMDHGADGQGVVDGAESSRSMGCRWL